MPRLQIKRVIFIAEVLILTLLVLPLATVSFLVTDAHAQQSTTGSSTSIVQVTVGGRTFSLPYSITGASVNSISADPSMPSIILNVSTTSSGTLNIQIPRSLLDAKMQDGVSDDQFLVFIDDIPNTDFSQTTASGSYRTLSIPFDETAQKIEIIGTVMPPASGSNIISTQGSNNASTGGGGVVKTPEFGSAGAVPMILLSISVLGIIALRSKCSRLCFRSKKQSSTLQ